MGGNAFKTKDKQRLTSDILKAEVDPTLSKFKKILDGIGVTKLVPLGSTGKKEISGDIDVAIGPFSAEELKNKKAEIVSYLKNKLGEENAKLLGQNIAVMFPISGRENEFVQIDVMMSSSPDDTGVLMSGSGDNVIKGVYRNLMLSYIAKLRSTEDVKITIAFPGGVQVAKGKEILVPRTENMTTIKKLLGIEDLDVSTFEKLVEDMSNDQELSQILSGFKEYIQRYLNDDDKETREDAQLAMSIIDSKIGKLQEKRLRQIIRFLLN